MAVTVATHAFITILVCSNLDVVYGYRFRFIRIPHAGHMFRPPWVKNQALQKIIVYLKQLDMIRCSIDRSR